MGTVFSGWLSDAFFYGRRNVLAFGFGVLNTVALCLFLYSGDGLIVNILSMILFGVAIGVLICFLGGLMAIDIVPREATGAALGIVGMASYVGAGPQEKGLWIGGKLGYWHDKTEGVKTDSFSIAPEAGYDFNKRWSVGVALGYEYLKVKDGGSANVFTASPYARYKYYNKGILSLFLDGGVGFACCDHEGFQAGITPGLSVKINEHFSFLTQVGFLGYRKDYFNGGSGEAFGLKLSSSDLKFGFYYKF